MTDPELTQIALELWRQDQQNPPTRDVRAHGTVYRYRHFKCRCTKCKQANSKAQRKLREVRFAKVARGFADFAHGQTGYTNWGCRCEVCSEAEAKAGRERYLRGKEKRAKVNS